ncbi:MAG: tetratricopeptide repeat protein [Acidobacteria bacterium]|nr:MAG: tetratricopeptide repeat protein [Acidobacteriota bacterium]REK03951.1 MAG: tetratricopeptide repeat protein [Acidobacteriota bacterium]REK15113.1 MAG: tetratricopeptide repeat protein [Acidobacteriota bacterium]REK46203.1 MAG: tetratricopeptide repeat protein [Acidobacteriota bacterium]
MSERIAVFEKMLEDDPGATMVMFGLANEYLKSGQTDKGIETLERYLKFGVDEGAAYGMLAKAYESQGNTEKARESYEKGIEIALAHNHPTMAEDFRFELENNFDD